jgi:hypothetical protein
VIREVAALEGDRGSDLRAVIRSLNHPFRPLDVLRNGPVPPGDLGNFSGVYERGRREILAWMHAANPSRQIQRQLPSL